MGVDSSTESTTCNNPDSFLARKIFSESYDLGKKLGAGSFASVHECFRKRDNMAFAVKVIDKTYLTNRELRCLRDEIHILKHISHENIIKLVDIFDDGYILYIILELCDGNDLFDAIVCSKNKQLTEQKAAQIVYCISKALQYLHENGVIHRDLKPENILFGIDGSIKISDFGLAHHQFNSISSDSVVMNTCCGTPHYVAPEIVTRNEYNHKCDTWSLGVILYVILVGYQPFNGDTLNEIYTLIAEGTYSFETERWRNISQEAQDLIKSLLVLDPKKRYAAKDIIAHKWIRKYCKVL